MSTRLELLRTFEKMRHDHESYRLNEICGDDILHTMMGNRKSLKSLKSKLHKEKNLYLDKQSDKLMIRDKKSNNIVLQTEKFNEVQLSLINKRISKEIDRISVQTTNASRMLSNHLGWLCSFIKHYYGIDCFSIGDSILFTANKKLEENAFDELMDFIDEVIPKS
jgi:hypothetical protein